MMSKEERADEERDLVIFEDTLVNNNFIKVSILATGPIRGTGKKLLQNPWKFLRVTRGQYYHFKSQSITAQSIEIEI